MEGGGRLSSTRLTITSFENKDTNFKYVHEIETLLIEDDDMSRSMSLTATKFWIILKKMRRQSVNNNEWYSCSQSFAASDHLVLDTVA